MTTTQQGQLRHNDVMQGAILSPPGDSIRCNVERIDNGQAHMRVLDNHTYNGQTEFTLKIDEMIAGRWQLTRRAA